MQSFPALFTIGVLQEKLKMTHWFLLLLVCFIGCSGPMARENPASGCDLCKPEDCPACDDVTVSVIPYEMPSNDPTTWGHDVQEQRGNWITIQSEDGNIGLLQDVDTTAYSAVIIPYAMELERTRRVRFEDSKIYQVDDGKGVRWVRLYLSSQLILDVCESRELLVDVVEGLLERLNADPAITSSFAHNPITASDLEIYIALDSFFVEYDNPTFIAWISLVDGDVRIIDGALKDFHKDFWNSRVEPYWKSHDFVMIARAARVELDKKYPIKRQNRTGKLFEIK